MNETKATNPYQSWLHEFYNQNIINIFSKENLCEEGCFPTNITFANSSLPIASTAFSVLISVASGKTIVFDCYHSAINGANGNYTQLTGVSASIDKASGDMTDTCVKISYGSGTLASGDKLVLSFALHYSDWSTFSSADDYSAQGLENIVIPSADNVIYGKEP